MKTHFTGWIKPGEYGKHIAKDGLKTFWVYPFWAIILLRLVKPLQKTLWLCGIAVHDPIFGECTPDFNCCCRIGRRAFIRLSSYKLTGATK